MTFCSAFAGVYFEKMVRSSPASSSGGKGLQQGAIKLSELGELWVKNIQLYLFSCISALAACLLHDGDKIAENGFFHGCVNVQYLKSICCCEEFHLEGSQKRSIVNH